MNLRMAHSLRARVEGEGPIYEGVCKLLERFGWQIVDEQPYHIQILANVTRLLPRDEIFSATYGTLCFHPSMLPRHRGRDAVYWTLEMGDKETGVTWFWLDDGIDTGDIAIQHVVRIPEGISPGRLYYGTLVPLGIELLEELLPRLACGDIPRIPQDESKATYERPRKKVKAHVTG